jgi:hypothetical protein
MERYARYVCEMRRAVNWLREAVDRREYMAAAAEVCSVKERYAEDLALLEPKK